jgi:hypothetical protein
MILALVAAAAVGGCVTARPGPSAASADQERADPAYWYRQPSPAPVTHDDFDALWAAAERAARDRLFRIDRTDYRNGILTTAPLVSQQAFEPWRSDTPLAQQAQSTLGTVRRTIRFEFERQADGRGFAVSPKVLIERQSLPAQRLSNAAQYRAGVYGVTGQTSDEGEQLASEYWYPIGRDTVLETRLAADIRGRLRHGRAAR